jgi:hypothetical protein
VARPEKYRYLESVSEGSHIAQRAVSQDGGIISRGEYLCIFAAVARVEKASLPPPREAAKTL